MLRHFAPRRSKHLIITLRLARVSATCGNIYATQRIQEGARRPPDGEVMLRNSQSKVQLFQGLCSVVFSALRRQAELMSGFIEFCVELKSVAEGVAVAAADVDGAIPQPSTGHEGGNRNGRGGRRGMLHRQNSVVCSRVHTLSTINYVDNGERHNGVEQSSNSLEILNALKILALNMSKFVFFSFLFLSGVIVHKFKKINK